MIISLISSLTVDHVIGMQGVIPWYFSIDMKWFQYHTLNKPIIMGRKTFESIGKKPLKNRLNIVLSHVLLKNYNNVYIVNNIEQALFLVRNHYEVMIIGGGEIYRFFFPLSQKLYLTYINTNINISGDTWFPIYDVLEWKIIFNKFCSVNEKNCHYNLSFNIFERL